MKGDKGTIGVGRNQCVLPLPRQARLSQNFAYQARGNTSWVLTMTGAESLAHLHIPSPDTEEERFLGSPLQTYPVRPDSVNYQLQCGPCFSPPPSLGKVVKVAIHIGVDSLIKT